MSRVAIIPARGGSTRVPRKNIRDFHGQPIMAYSVVAALKSNLFDQVVVSTDDHEIGRVARKYGADVASRPSRLSQNEVGTQEVAGYVLTQLVVKPDWACVIYATAPMLLPSDLWRGYEALQSYERIIDYAFAVGAEPLRDAGQWYWGRADAFLQGKHLIGTRTAMIPIEESRVIDINTPEDWSQAERMYAAWKETVGG